MQQKYDLAANETRMTGVHGSALVIVASTYPVFVKAMGQSGRITAEYKLQAGQGFRMKTETFFKQLWLRSESAQADIIIDVETEEFIDKRAQGEVQVTETPATSYATPEAQRNLTDTADTIAANAARRDCLISVAAASAADAILFVFSSANNKGTPVYPGQTFTAENFAGAIDIYAYKNCKVNVTEILKP